MAPLEYEWGYVDDLQDVIEGLSGVALLALHRWGLTDPRISYVMGAIGVTEELLADAEPHLTTGGTGGQVASPPE